MHHTAAPSDLSFANFPAFSWQHANERTSSSAEYLANRLDVLKHSYPFSLALSLPSISSIGLDTISCFIGPYLSLAASLAKRLRIVSE